MKNLSEFINESILESKIEDFSSDERTTFENALNDIYNKLKSAVEPTLEFCEPSKQKLPYIQAQRCYKQYKDRKGCYVSVWDQLPSFSADKIDKNEFDKAVEKATDTLSKYFGVSPKDIETADEVAKGNRFITTYGDLNSRALAKLEKLPTKDLGDGLFISLVDMRVAYGGKGKHIPDYFSPNPFVNTIHTLFCVWKIDNK